jgi:tRNA A-37 threonylcarbamoyl transferase component Bud32
MITATRVGRYEILGELGRGAMGVVYRAKDPVIGRTVAVKTIRISEEGTGMSRAQLVERFETEARTAGLLTHPNIVVIHDAGEADGLYYITMELVNGKSLQSMLDAGQKIPLPRLLHIMDQVCSALQFAHNHNVVHRDIKPANIMLYGDDVVKVTDFGTAMILQYGAPNRTEAMGTPCYMSPELIKGKALDGRTDIFSLGVMLYEMTTGQKPFLGKDIATILYQVLNDDPVPPHQLNPSIPLGVSSTIMKALTKSPHLRYDNCRDLMEDLKHYRPGENEPNANAAPSANRVSARPVPREAKGKSYSAAMPQIPGVEVRSTPPAPSRPRLIPPPPAEAAAKVLRPETEQPMEGVYAGPPSKFNRAAVLRMVTIGASILVAAVLGWYGVKSLGLFHRPDSDAIPARQEGGIPAQPQSTNVDSERQPLYATQSNPEIAAVSELAQPWSSRKFFFRSMTEAKNVPALIVRLPGPAAQSKSYWAFSLDTPFNQCQFEYIQDLAKLSSEYEFEAKHPMVVNPCTHTVFDPLQLKELPGNILVRGAVVRGFDPRPPFGIELKVSGDQIQAVAME